MLLMLAPDNQQLDYLLSQVTVTDTKTIGSIVLRSVSKDGYAFVLVMSGYGKVNISRAVALSQALYPVTAAVCIGTAGGSAFNAHEGLGVMICESAVQYDVDFTALGHKPGNLPGLPSALYDADETLMRCADAALRSLHFPHRAELFASADRFVGDDCLRMQIFEQFGAHVFDAETGAVGESAYLAGLPYTAIKALSNDAGCRAVSQYLRYNGEAGFLVQQAALAFVKEYRVLNPQQNP